MSLNTAHVNGGVLIHAGESILLFSEDVSMDFSGQDSSVFKGTKTGRLYLTTHRMIFNNSKQADSLLSFSFPFVTLSEVELEQPIFGANFIKGKVRAQPNGNWVGEAKFKLVFKKGGAIDFAQAMLQAVALAANNANSDAPPPYTPPSGEWYQAPPPAYAADPNGYYGWVPPYNVFPMQPPANSVYMSENPPPYPGINATYGGYGTLPSMPPGAGFVQSPTAGMNGNAKATEAAQNAYYDPNRPQCAYVPPPAYYEPPPAYQEANKKNQ